MRELFPTDLEARMSGDHRVPENPGLSTIHTIFFKEHNRIAEELAKTNALGEYLKNYPAVEQQDDLIFYESRRLNAAMFQSIIYREYLPLVVGPKLMEEYDLNVQLDKRSSYDRNANPTHLNEFATFAYRFGHTLIADTYHRLLNKRNNTFSLKDSFFVNSFMNDQHRRPYWLPILRGLVHQEAEAADRFIGDSLGNFLYFGREKVEKDKDHKRRVELSDLGARNIHRGRDHGLTDYNSYRIWAGLTDLTSLGIKDCKSECCAPVERQGKKLRRCRDGNQENCFSRCTDTPTICKTCLDARANDVKANTALQVSDMSVDNFVDLGKAYFWMLDIIDPFPGTMSETNVDGGSVGPTNGKIIADQFKRLKFGDRFFFNHKEEGNVRPLGAVANQNIMKRTFSAVLCDVAPVKPTKLDQLSFPQNAFLRQSSVKKCSEILKDTSFDFEKIAQEIVDSLNNDNKQRCQWDEDCPDEGLGTSYPVCNSEVCQLVTSECSHDTDCSGSECKDNFCLYQKKNTEFREECQKNKNCENTNDCN